LAAWVPGDHRSQVEGRDVVVGRRSVRVHEPSGVRQGEGRQIEGRQSGDRWREAQHREVHRFLDLTNEVRRREVR